MGRRGSLLRGRPVRVAFSSRHVFHGREGSQGLARDNCHHNGLRSLGLHRSARLGREPLRFNRVVNGDEMVRGGWCWNTAQREGVERPISAGNCRADPSEMHNIDIVATRGSFSGTCCGRFLPIRVQNVPQAFSLVRSWTQMVPERVSPASVSNLI